MSISRSAIKKGILNDIIYSQLFWAFFILTILMVVVGGIFHIPGIVDHPQFGSEADANFIKEILWGKEYRSVYPFHFRASYYLYFLLDVFWALLLLLILRKFIKKQIIRYPDSYPGNSLQIVTFLIIFAYLFDILENISYSVYIEYNKVFVYLKLLFYFLVAIIFVFSYLRYFVDRLSGTFLRFLKSAIYSLFILVVIGLLLPKAPQVNSIVVDLYEDPLNMAILLIIGAPFFSIVLAHYPSYFKIKKNERDWFMAKGTRFIFGIVYYRYKKGFLKTKDGVTEGGLNFLFRSLGICFYAALFYMIAYTSEVNFNWSIQTAGLSLLLLFGGILLMYHLKQYKDAWYEKTYDYLSEKLPFYYDGDHTPYKDKAGELPPERIASIQDQKIKPEDTQDDINRKLKSINGHLLTHVAILTITILVHLLLIIVLFTCDGCRYSEITVIISLFCIVLQTISFVYYRIFRSLLKFTFFNRNSKATLRSFLNEADDRSQSLDGISDPSYYSNKVLLFRFFDEHDFKGDNVVIQFLSKIKFGAFSDSVFFLQKNALLGIFNTIFFLIINIYGTLSLRFNAALVIMSALFLYYGILVVLTKTIIYYYNSNEDYAKKYGSVLLYSSTIVIAILLGLNAYVLKTGNNLFTLQPLARTSGNEISLSTFKKPFDKNKTRTRYYIGCYGGGMKSNAWTMTVLNKLHDEDNSIFEKTVGISGASGGTMGLINMFSIIKNNDNDSLWQGIIKDISTENILSLDLTHTLGRDSFYKLFIPKCDLSEYDRSSKAMERYAYLARGGNELCQKTSYREYWRSKLDSMEIKFPILIANSTNVQGRQGMAVSVKIDSAYSRELLYHGADDILELKWIENKCVDTVFKEGTLDYYDAASTSNRFPIISPAAKIETKGHFNDGGIYDNSGMLSAYKLFQAVCHLDSVQDYNDLKQRNVFINIVNDKNQYVRKILENKLCEIKKINSYTELSSLLSSVASTEMMPRYIKDKLKRLSEDYPGKIEFESIYLPHRFTVEDIKSIYGKEIACAKKKDSTSIDEFLHNIVYENNTRIEKMVNARCDMGTKPIIEPPMSRVMTESAYDFMDSMLEHRLTKESLARIYNN